jgi:DNA (cytosine-5)-methyltransferase 1
VRRPRRPHPAPPLTRARSQPHSKLNRFQIDDDAKSSLVLTMLSYIDELRPAHVLLENVPGFLSYELPAAPPLARGAHGSGLRLFAAAMTRMGYQLRCVQLSAAHFGAPQTRTRFFLLAARAGAPLPLDPAPTHAFNAGALALRLEPRARAPAPVLPPRGAFLFAHTTVEDAIGDLWAFDACVPVPVPVPTPVRS